MELSALLSSWVKRHCACCKALFALQDSFELELVTKWFRNLNSIIRDERQKIKFKRLSSRDTRSGRLRLSSVLSDR